MVVALDNKRPLKWGLALFAAVMLAARPVHAGDQQAVPRPAAAQPQVRMPGAEQIVVLIRNTLITLNDALATGNFTVLRDRAAPSFQSANTAARLSRIYQGLGQQGVDLSGVVLAAPQLTATPMIDANQRLHLEGHFPLQPTGFKFGLMFEMSGGRWRLFGISVNPAPAAPAPVTAKKKSAPAWGATVSSR